mmetsp:Transcript_17729/g.47158  ORF Transcript_17729/g.47158 Transcript_17729/m.47158 type:complete len:83 (-) Transcript_17729:1260-1508(-)
MRSKNGAPAPRVRGCYGGNVNDYTGPTSAWTASIQTVKILLNAVISENANWPTFDLKDFYLGTTLERPKYMRIHRCCLGFGF